MIETKIKIIYSFNIHVYINQLQAWGKVKLQTCHLWEPMSLIPHTNAMFYHWANGRFMASDT